MEPDIRNSGTKGERESFAFLHKESSDNPYLKIHDFSRLTEPETLDPDHSHYPTVGVMIRVRIRSATLLNKYWIRMNVRILSKIIGVWYQRFHGLDLQAPLDPDQCQDPQHH